MRRFPKLLLGLAPAGLLVYSLSSLKADDSIPIANSKVEVARNTGQAVEPDSGIKQVQAGVEQAPPQTTPTTGASPGSSLFQVPSSGAQSNTGGSALSQTASSQMQSEAATVPAYNAISGQQSTNLAATDSGDLLGKSDSATGINTQKRSPIVNEPHIRGFNIGEIITTADGVPWFPARQDLDTFLSKIDSGNIKDLLVIKGPYSAQFGPAFSFIDIESQDAPRSENGGTEVHGRTVFNYNSNGQGFYGRQDLSVAGPWWGAKISYGQRTSNDYHNGADIDIPSSYDSRDVDFLFGMNLTSNSKIEADYLHLDQTGLEFPLQVFTTKVLTTNGARLRYTIDNEPIFDKVQVDVFWNGTDLTGVSNAPYTLTPVLNTFKGFTDVDQTTFGYRSSVNWGKLQNHEQQLTVGSDFRYLTQSLDEFSNKGGIVGSANGLDNNPIPPSYQANAGVFSEYAVPVGESWTVKVGARADYNQSDVTGISPDFSQRGFTAAQNFIYFGVPAAAQNNSALPPDLFRGYGMWMVFGTAECKVNDNWTIGFGAGHADRPPTITELYAMNPFLAVLQNGTTTVAGNPELKPESLWQIDINTKASYDQILRAGASAHISWINDYITFANRPDLTGFYLPYVNPVQFENTSLAILGGTELYGELDVTGWFTTFGTLSYTAGVDSSRHQVIITNGQNNGQPIYASSFSVNNAQEPLPAMAPLESRLGFRVHEARQDPKYGVELAVRIDASQQFVASSLGEQPTSAFSVWDLRSYWHVTSRWSLTAGIENIFDRVYRENYDLLTGSVAPLGQSPTAVYGFDRPGRNYYFGTELKF